MNLEVLDGTCGKDDWRFETVKSFIKGRKGEKVMK